MKNLRTIFAGIFAAVAFLSLGVLAASAQGPVAYLDNQSHTIAGNASQLFRFDYAIDTSDYSRPLTTITLVNGNNNGVGFEVWTADQLAHQASSLEDAVADKADNQPIGRGTAANVDCDTGEVTGSGSCKSPDLTWNGTFGSSGAYYVKIINSSSSSVKYQLMIQGSGVSLRPQQQVAAVKPATQPAAAPALSATTDDPNRAAALDTAMHALPANSGTWFRFDYAINSDYTRPLDILRLVNGNNTGLQLEVWTADQLAHRASSLEDATADKANNQPIGRGTSQTVDCDSGQVTGSGSCKSADLIWEGTFGSNTTVFVHVINPTNSPQNYQLMMTTQ